MSHPPISHILCLPYSLPEYSIRKWQYNAMQQVCAFSTEDIHVMWHNSVTMYFQMPVLSTVDSNII